MNLRRNKLFIQANKKQLLGALVAQYSFMKNSRDPDFQIEILMAEDYPVLGSREGQLHLREGKKVVWRNDLQSFTPLRFLPPQKMDYLGKAIVIDPDVFAIADCMELFNKDMQGKAIWSRKITEKSGNTYWASSVMLLDCEKLKHWQWEKSVEELFTFQRDYRKWVSLDYENQNTIGELSEEWNHYDTLNSSTKFLHNTGRATQPWKTGLPIDFSYSHKKVAPKPTFLKKLKSIVGVDDIYSNNAAEGRYKPHPDPKQEKFFMSLLAECIHRKHISQDFVNSEIKDGNVRADIFEVMNGAQSEIRI